MVTPDTFRCHTEAKMSKNILCLHVKKEKDMLKELKEKISLMSEWEMSMEKQSLHKEMNGNSMVEKIKELNIY